jgi:hypothetical protein
MPRHSISLSDKPEGKQIEHYINGIDNSEGMHPGIKSRCSICNRRHRSTYCKHGDSRIKSHESCNGFIADGVILCECGCHITITKRK